VWWIPFKWASKGV